MFSSLLLRSTMVTTDASESTVTTVPFFLVELMGQPVVAAAVVTAAVAILGLIVNFFLVYHLQRERFEFDRHLSRERFDNDVHLSKRKLAFDQRLELWRRKVVFAEDALTDLYNSAFALSAIRSPAAYSDEYEDRPGRDQEDEALRRARDTYFPILKRLQNKEYTEVLASMWARRFRAKALFGPNADQPFIRMRQVLAQVQTAAMILMRADTHTDIGSMREHRTAMEARVWEGASEIDAISNEIAAILTEAESIFRPALEAFPIPDAIEEA